MHLWERIENIGEGIMSKPKEMGFGWKPPPKDRSTMMWPNSYPISGKRAKSPQGKGFSKSKLLDISGAVGNYSIQLSYNGHGYYENMEVSHGQVRKFRLYFLNRVGVWTSEDIGREQACEIVQSVGESLPDWNEEIIIQDGSLKIKGVGE